MKKTTKWRRWWAKFLPIYFQVSKYKYSNRSKRSFMVRGRILHKGFQILEEIRSFDENNSAPYYKLITNCDNWEDVLKYRKQIRKILTGVNNKKGKFKADLNEVLYVKV